MRGPDFSPFWSLLFRARLARFSNLLSLRACQAVRRVAQWLEMNGTGRKGVGAVSKKGTEPKTEEL